MTDQSVVRAGRSDKYGQVYVERVGNTGFPDPDEPIALLRGQDKYAWAAMLFYKSRIDHDPDVPYAQRQSVARQCYRFQLFANNNRDKMRTPGTPPDSTTCDESGASMTFEEFEQQIEPVKRDPDLDGLGLLLYQSNAMAGEAGEVANVVKKAVRDGLQLDTNDRLLDECGDVLFYMRRLLVQRGYSIEDAAGALLAKLERQRGASNAAPDEESAS